MGIEINQNNIELFAKTFSDQMRRPVYDELPNSGLEDYLPRAFTGISVNITSYYSEDREHILIVFFKSDEYKFSFRNVNGNVFDVYDPFKLWDRRSGIKIRNGRKIKLKSSSILGMRPLDLYGEIEVIIEELKIQNPFPRFLATLDYVLVFSKDIFLDRLRTIEKFSNIISMNYRDFYERTGEKFDSESKKAIEYKTDLEMLKMEMENYFFNKRFKETEIDDYIGKNPFIIKFGLGLSKYFSPMVLEDINGEYKQDLKPDLVGFDSVEGHWTIVDYKLPWKKLMRGEGTVRASVTSDITQLHSQLKTYRDYFSDLSQRTHVNNKYKIDINKYPPSIGIVGTVTDEQREDFNEMRQEYPGWFKVMSYDELYKKVCNVIDVINEIE